MNAKKGWLLLLVVLLCTLTDSLEVRAAAKHDNQVTQDPASWQRPPRWTMAGNEANADWLLYATAGGISSIVPDGERLWVASTGGLLRWDRATGDLTQYLAPRVPLPSNDLERLLLHDGQLYISAKGGVAVWDFKDEWTVYSNQTIGAEISYNAALAMVDEVLWVSTATGVAQRFPDGRWVTVAGNSAAFPLPTATRFVTDENGLYAEFVSGPRDALIRRAARFEDGRWREIDQPLLAEVIAADGSWWRRGWPDQDGELLRSTDKGQSWQSVFTGDTLIRPLATDAEGLVYAGDGDCVRLFRASELVESYCFTDIGPELTYTNHIERDEAGRMWFATDGRGLTMFDGEQWHNWQPETSDLREDAIRGLAVRGDTVYAGVFGSAASGGVSIYDAAAARWTNLWPGESELSGGGVGGIAIDAQGRAYLPTAAAILDIYDDGQWQHVPIEPMSPVILVQTTSAAFDRDGNYWLATRGAGIWKYDGQGWQTFGVADGLFSENVNALAFDPNGALWAATNEGLAMRSPDGRWHAYQAGQSPLGDGWLKDVAVDAAGRVWTINQQALTVFDGKTWHTFAPAEVGGDTWGDAIGFDAQGRAWAEVGSNAVAIFTGQLPLGPQAGAPELPPALPPPPISVAQPSGTVPNTLPLLTILVVVLGVILVGGTARALAHTRAQPSPLTTEGEAPPGSLLAAVAVTVTGLAIIFLAAITFSELLGQDLWWAALPLAYLLVWGIARPIADRRKLTEFYAIVPTRRDRLAFFGAVAVLLLVGYWHRGEGSLWVRLLYLAAGFVAALGVAFAFGGPTLRRYIRENVWTFKRDQE